MKWKIIPDIRVEWRNYTTHDQGSSGKCAKNQTFINSCSNSRHTLTHAGAACVRLHVPRVKQSKSRCTSCYRMQGQQDTRVTEETRCALRVAWTRDPQACEGEGMGGGDWVGGLL